MTSASGLDRREWIARVLQLAGGAGLALKAGASQWTPQVLTPTQNEALITIGEQIIPGSTVALCSRTIDLVLTMESEQTRSQLTDALALFGKNGDRAALREASETGSPLHPQFLVIKEWVADAYWSSEAGLRELGSTGNVAWTTFPGCATR